MSFNICDLYYPAKWLSIPNLFHSLTRPWSFAYGNDYIHSWFHLFTSSECSLLYHTSAPWGLKIMVSILQTAFSYIFSWTRIYSNSTELCYRRSNWVSALAQTMAWHQSRLRALMPYGVTRAHWVKFHVNQTGCTWFHSLLLLSMCIYLPRSSYPTNYCIITSTVPCLVIGGARRT